MCGAGFPEPYAFQPSGPASAAHPAGDFDLVHDNQCLGRGSSR